MFAKGLTWHMDEIPREMFYKMGGGNSVWTRTCGMMSRGDISVITLLEELVCCQQPALWQNLYLIATEEEPSSKAGYKKFCLIIIHSKSHA